MAKSWRDAGKGKSGRPDESPARTPQSKPVAPPSSPSSNTPPARAGWRKGQAAPASRRHWQEGASRSLLSNRHIQLALLLVTSIGLIGWFVKTLILMPKPLTIIALAATSYPAPFPPNALAQEDLQRMETTFRHYENIRCATQSNLHGSGEQFLATLRDAIAPVEPGGPQKDTVVIYLSLHGVVDDDGQPCLLTTESDPTARTTWLPFEQVVTVLQSNKKLAPAYKLLILDDGKLTDCWQAGIVRNDFATALKSWITSHPEQCQRLAILHAADVHSQAALFPEASCTAFGYFVTAGLRGAARQDDRQVTLGELADYVQQQVLLWSRDQRAVRQVSELLVADESAFPRSHRLAETNDPRAPDVQPLAWQQHLDSIQEVWRRFAELQATNAAHRDPQRWAHLQQHLTRLEQLLPAGQAYQEQLTLTIREANHVADELRQRHLRAALPSVSLAMSKQQPTWDPQAWEQSLKTWDAWEKTLVPTAAHEVPTSTSATTRLASVATPNEPAAATPSANASDSAAQPTPNGTTPAESPATTGATEAKASDKPVSPPAPASPPPPAPMPTIPYEHLAEHIWQQVTDRPWDSNWLEREFHWLSQQSPPPHVEPREIHFVRLLLDAQRGRKDASEAAEALALAISGERLAAQAGAIGESRVHYWIQSTVARADEQARNALDQTLIGGPAASAIAQRHWNIVRDLSKPDSYASAIAAAQIVAQAFQLRDQIASELPQFARWSLAPDASPLARESLEPLRIVATKAQALARLLDDPRADRPEAQTWQELQQHVAAIGPAWNALQQAYTRECHELARIQGNDHRSRQQAIRVLRVALIPGDIGLRTDLWRRYWQQAFPPLTASQLVTSSSSPPTPSSEDDNAATLAATQWTNFLVHVWLADPSLESIESNQPTTAPADSMALAKASSALRRRLAELPTELGKLAKLPWSEPSAEQAEQAPLERLALSRGDHTARHAAAFFARAPWPRDEEDPTWQLQTIDDHGYTLWLARRALRDAWGSPDSNEPPYFELVVDQQMEAARRLWRAGTGYRVPLENGLQDTKSALLAWEPLAARDLEFQRDQENETFVRHQVTYSGGEKLPPGTAAFAIRDESNAIVSVRDEARQQSLTTRAVAMATPNRLTHWFENTAALRDNHALRADINFRGHHRQTELRLNAQLNTAIATWKLKPALRPQVKVMGNAQQRSRVLFVLDCSQSMRFEHEFGGITQSRLAIANEVLQGLIKELDPDSFEIGLMLYGNRAGWKKVDAGRYGIDMKGGGPEVHPGADVQVVVPVARITSSDYRTGRATDVREVVRDALQAAVQRGPTGATPLYFAMVRAAEELHRAGAQPGSPQHIVVVTDGADDPTSQILPERFPAYARQSDATVARALQGIHLHIVGFSARPVRFQPGTNDQRDWEKQASSWQRDKATLERLATSSGGQWHDVADPSGLQQAITASLQLRRFFVCPPEGTEPPREAQVDLAHLWTMPASQRPGPYQVQIVGLPATRTNIDLHEGDRLELIFNQQTGRLEPHRFEEELQSQAIIQDVFVGHHTPKLDTATRQYIFRASIQHTDEHRYPARPAAVWAEIIPRAANDTSTAQPERVFFAYDLEFEPSRPVPVVAFRIGGWPESMRQAELRLWFTPQLANRYFTRVPIDLTKPTDQTLRDGTHLHAEPRPGEDQTIRIDIEEEHPEGAPAEPLYLQMTPLPDEVTHQFVPEARRAKHTIVYHHRDPRQLGTPVLLVTTKQIIEKEWSSSGPLLVKLPNR